MQAARLLGGNAGAPPAPRGERRHSTQKAQGRHGRALAVPVSSLVFFLHQVAGTPVRHSHKVRNSSMRQRFVVGLGLVLVSEDRTRFRRPCRRHRSSELRSEVALKGQCQTAGYFLIGLPLIRAFAASERGKVTQFFQMLAGKLTSAISAYCCQERTCFRIQERQQARKRLARAVLYSLLCENGTHEEQTGPHALGEGCSGSVILWIRE